MTTYEPTLNQTNFKINDSRGAFFQIDNEIVYEFLSAGKIDTYDFTIYCVLAMLANSKNKSWPSYEYLIETSNISRGKIWKCLTSLENAGLLKRDSSGRFNVYILLPIAKSKSGYLSLHGKKNSSPDELDNSTSSFREHQSSPHERQSSPGEPYKDSLLIPIKKKKEQTVSPFTTKEIDTLLVIDPSLRSDICKKYDEQPEHIRKLINTAKKMIGEFTASKILAAWEVLRADQWYVDKGFANVWYLFGDGPERSGVKIEKLLSKQQPTQPDKPRHYINEEPGYKQMMREINGEPANK